MCLLFCYICSNLPTLTLSSYNKLTVPKRVKVSHVSDVYFVVNNGMSVSRPKRSDRARRASHSLIRSVNGQLLPEPCHRPHPETDPLLVLSRSLVDATSYRESRRHEILGFKEEEPEILEFKEEISDRRCWNTNTLGSDLNYQGAVNLNVYSNDNTYTDTHTVSQCSNTLVDDELQLVNDGSLDNDDTIDDDDSLISIDTNFITDSFSFGADWDEEDEVEDLIFCEESLGNLLPVEDRASRSLLQGAILGCQHHGDTLSCHGDEGDDSAHGKVWGLLGVLFVFLLARVGYQAWLLAQLHASGSTTVIKFLFVSSDLLLRFSGPACMGFSYLPSPLVYKTVQEIRKIATYHFI